jgi:hypothetical protein
MEINKLSVLKIQPSAEIFRFFVSIKAIFEDMVCIVFSFCVIVKREPEKGR